MKIHQLILVILVLVVPTFCSKQPKGSSENSIDYTAFEVVKKKVSHFRELGDISWAVKLETTENALLGTIYHALIDENTGDILVGDFDTNKKVFRFDRNGHYISSYGKIGQGPGEYDYLNQFACSPNGDVILVSDYKLLKYSREGALLLEKRIDYFANDITIIDNLIYISICTFRLTPFGKNAIFVLNMDFEMVDQITEYDRRLEKYSFITSKHLAPKNNGLYFLDFYDLSINVFKTNIKKTYKMAVPNDNNKLDTIWNKKRLSEEDMTSIKKHLHRFRYIYAYKDGLILFEVCKEKKIYNLWLFDPDRKKVKIFSYYSLCRDSDIEFHPDLYFDWIAGSYDKGIIGVLDTVDEFKAYKDNYPALKDLSLKTDENPILVFFEFDMNKIEKGESK